MSESFEKAVEAAHASIAGTFEERGCTLSRSAVYTMLTAALPHLTAEDVPHLIRQAKAEAWPEGYDRALRSHCDALDLDGRCDVEDPNPYAEEADHE